ncbi:hypothetical protein SBADM41S_04824 [Streptomyces badius]
MTTGAAGSATAPVAAGAEPRGHSPADERKPATWSSRDLVGSTALSGVLDPLAATRTLRYFEAMSAEIVARGGTPEKFIGDAVMAVFGVPVVRDDDARRALAAALGMRRALARLNEELAATLGIELAIRIGVNTGQVVAGSDRTARQALVSGETVNIAARLEQNAGRGEIRRPGTLLAAGPTVRAEPTGPLRLKGKRDSVEAHRLLALGADDPELLRRFDYPFVWRAPAGAGRRAGARQGADGLRAAGSGIKRRRVGGGAAVRRARRNGSAVPQLRGPRHPRRRWPTRCAPCWPRRTPRRTRRRPPTGRRSTTRWLGGPGRWGRYGQRGSLKDTARPAATCSWTGGPAPGRPAGRLHGAGAGCWSARCTG